MRVAFFQRFFAHYQWGLMQELAEHSEHEYVFFGDKRDPAGSGIAPIPLERRHLVDYRDIKVWQIGAYLAIQPAAVQTAFIGNYDVYIFEGSFLHPSTWTAMLAAKGRGKRVLLYTHGWRRRDTNPVVSSARLAFYRMADGLLLYGRRAKSIGSTLGIPSETMYIVYNSLDYRTMVQLRSAISPEQHDRRREDLFGDRKLPIIIHVGRLTAVKRLDLLVEACGLALRKGHRLGLLIVGDGPQKKALKKRVSQLGIPTFFTGPLYDETQLSLMISVSNVLVVPGAIGLSAIHAMTYGTPVVTSNNFEKQMPEVEAVIPGWTGAFFQAGNVESLFEAVVPFLGPESRSKYASHCISIVDRFYNPVYMRRVFDRAVRGDSAVDEVYPNFDTKTSS